MKTKESGGNCFSLKSWVNNQFEYTVGEQPYVLSDLKVCYELWL